MLSSLLVGIEYLLPLIMSLGWKLSVGMIVRAVVREKESRMKEVMRMMGLGRGQLWFSWFTTSFLTLLISVVLITLSLKVLYIYHNILYILLNLIVWGLFPVHRWFYNFHLSLIIFSVSYSVLVSMYYMSQYIMFLLVSFAVLSLQMLIWEPV